MTRVLRVVALVLLAIPSPIFVVIPLLWCWLIDLAWLVFGQRRPVQEVNPRTDAASVVIPNWNGKDLLSKYLPPLIEAMSGHPDNEIIVVDNGSEDGSAALVQSQFPSVSVLALEQNLGFGGGSNAGFRAAKNDIVVLLNSDMRVERDFLRPLLRSFTDEKVFAVSCQIFFSDPAKLREETGLTQGWWQSGRLRVRHRIDAAIADAYPCFYGGGGSCAFDRRKFLELGGFDELLKPFYLEDTDIGYLAWKRGWKVLYQPQSVVYHEHRGTIGKKFSRSYIDAVIKKNFLLFCWKNIHEPARLLAHFSYAWADVLVSFAFGDSPERASYGGLLRAFVQLPKCARSRWRARSLAVIDDSEAFRRPLGGYFRDRFQHLPPDTDRLSVIFVSPYPICPPVHGGGVFMYQTTKTLADLCDLHLIVLLDFEHQRAAHNELVSRCASAEFIVRMGGGNHAFGSAVPHAITEFQNSDLEWLIHRQIYTKQADILQLEYLPMGQYAGNFRQIASILFEHDIYFQSIARQLPGLKGGLRRISATFEYLRALRYELKLLPSADRIQVCSRDNHRHLLSYLPQLTGRIDDDLRAGIDTEDYDFRLDGREPRTMLFIGSFRHLPNQEALEWFTRAVMPRVLQAKPEARLIVVGSDPPPRHSLPDHGGAVELKGFVDNVREPLSRYSVFVCPILSGSGMRVKLLEAFAAGIPVVSTRIGAEGLADTDGCVSALADDPQGFADRIIQLFDHPETGEAMAVRARQHVSDSLDMRALTRKLEKSYRTTVRIKRQQMTSVS